MMRHQVDWKKLDLCHKTRKFQDLLPVILLVVCFPNYIHGHIRHY